MILRPPTEEADALVWVQEAMAARRYVLHTHFLDRLADRDISFRSARHAIANATSCKPYTPERGPIAGGTSWRIAGPDEQGVVTSIGVEAFVDHLGRRALLITVF